MISDNVFVFFKGDDEPRPMKMGKVTDINITVDEDHPHRSIFTTREASFSVKIDPTEIDPADLHRLDVMFCPYAILCNPKDEHLFSEYKKKGFIIRPDPNIPEGKGTIIDRRETEEF